MMAGYLPGTLERRDGRHARLPANDQPQLHTAINLLAYWQVNSQWPPKAYPHLL